MRISRQVHVLFYPRILEIDLLLSVLLCRLRCGSRACSIRQKHQRPAGPSRMSVHCLSTIGLQLLEGLRAINIKYFRCGPADCCRICRIWRRIQERPVWQLAHPRASDVSLSCRLQILHSTFEAVVCMHCENMYRRFHDMQFDVGRLCLSDSVLSRIEPGAHMWVG